MTKEVIREMYQLLLTEPHAPTVCAKLERIARDALARPDHIPDAKKMVAQPEQEPVGKLQEAAAERAWFTIAELNAWADKKLSENPHWVMPKDEPERDEPPPQRTWVGLTDEEKQDWIDAMPYNIEKRHCMVLVKVIEDILKGKNSA